MSLEDFMLPCPIKKYLGFECFGCGMQRALLYVLEGKFSEAFKTYPAVYTVILLALMILLSVLDKKRSYKKFIAPLIFLNIVIIIVSYFYRHF